MEQYLQNVTNMSQYVFKIRLLLSNNTMIMKVKCGKILLNQNGNIWGIVRNYCDKSVTNIQSHFISLTSVVPIAGGSIGSRTPDQLIKSPTNPCNISFLTQNSRHTNAYNRFECIRNSYKWKGEKCQNQNNTPIGSKQYGIIIYQSL